MAFLEWMNMAIEQEGIIVVCWHFLDLIEKGGMH